MFYAIARQCHKLLSLLESCCSRGGASTKRYNNLAVSSPYGCRYAIPFGRSYRSSGFIPTKSGTKEGLRTTNRNTSSKLMSSDACLFSCFPWCIDLRSSASMVKEATRRLCVSRVAMLWLLPSTSLPKRSRELAPEGASMTFAG